MSCLLVLRLTYAESRTQAGVCIHLTLLKLLPALSSLRIWSLTSSVYVALRCGSTRPSTIGDAISSSDVAFLPFLLYSCSFERSVYGNPRFGKRKSNFER